MLRSKFAELVRYYTKSNSTTFPDAEILTLTNIFKDDISARIGKDVGEDYFGLRFETDLIGGTPPLPPLTVIPPGNREYQLPSEVMGRIKYLEAKLDGVNWQRLRETDLSSYEQGMSEADIQANYSGKDPEYDIWDKGIYIFSGTQINQVTNGLRLWAIIWPADITNLTDPVDLSTDPDEYSHGFPKEFHELLARRVSIAYKSSKDRPVPLSDKELSYEMDLQRAINNLKDMNLDRDVIVTVPRNDGSNF